MTDLSDAHAMALERSCAVTAVALSEQRREGVRLVTGTHRTFGLERRADARPHPLSGGPRLDAQDPDMRCRAAMFAVEGSPDRVRLNELSARELRALLLVEAGVAIGWIASRWPGLLTELRRVLPDIDGAAADTDAKAMLTEAVALAQTSQPLDVHPLLGTLPLAYTMPAGSGRPNAAQLRPDAVDHDAEAPSPTVFRTGGW